MKQKFSECSHTNTHTHTHFKYKAREPSKQTHTHTRIWWTDYGELGKGVLILLTKIQLKLSQCLRNAIHSLECKRGLRFDLRLYSVLLFNQSWLKRTTSNSWNWFLFFLCVWNWTILKTEYWSQEMDKLLAMKNKRPSENKINKL